MYYPQTPQNLFQAPISIYEPPKKLWIYFKYQYLPVELKNLTAAVCDGYMKVALVRVIVQKVSW